MNGWVQPESTYAGFSEAGVEDAAMDVLRDLGWACRTADEIGPDGSAPLRAAYSDVVHEGVLRAVVARLNPGVPEDAREEAIRQLLRAETQNLVEENRRLHRLLTEGVPVEVATDDGTVRGARVAVIDWGDPASNDWLATRQFAVVENGHDRRPDLVLFVNGLPLAVVELKNPASENATLEGAWNQLQTYKTQVPNLFRTNAVLAISDGLKARVGSLTADLERFMPWRSEDGDDLTPTSAYELDTALRGVFEPARFLALVQDFTVFGDRGDGPFKIVAGYHQFHGARKALARAEEAIGPDGDGRIGVIWHTQGSGKSLLMAFLAGLLVRSEALENPTLVVLTDRNDLDDQLHGIFALCRDLIRQKPVQAAGRDDLRRALDRAAGGVIFTTVQKFAPEPGEETVPVLTDRRNVIVFADEAHRSQYGFDAVVGAKGQRRYGFAHHVRSALPNASFIGFTGTPVELENADTRAVFGEDIDIYDIARAVEDGATVPIYYESRLARIELDSGAKERIDAEIEALVEEDDLEGREAEKARWSTVERLVGSDKRLNEVAADLVAHLEARLDGMAGRAMAVCMSRRICVGLYDAIVRLRPDWRSDDDGAGAVKVVMTGAASDPPEWQAHIRPKRARDAIAKRARDPDDPLKLVIVRDMWLTGFDAPPMHTMYVDKPMRGHNLMQAIARVNRVFRDKPGGLVVDYIGIAQNLRNALGQYSKGDRERVGIDEEEAEAVLREELDRVRAMLHGHDYAKGIDGTSHERLVTLAETLDVILRRIEEWVGAAGDDAARREARQRFPDAVLRLGKAFALTASTDYARTVRDEVGFLQAVRATLVKRDTMGAIAAKDRALAIDQLLNDAIANAEIVDILRAAGLSSPDLAILSDEFLAGIREMKQRNLALEALKKLLAGEVRSRRKSNVVEARLFSERLEAAVARYHANAISAAEMIDELINLARDMTASVRRGEETGLSNDEIAFYDALAENESAVEAMGSVQLRIIAHELVETMRREATVDWHHRESARARMRVLVKRILKRHGYPPDLQREAVKTVLRQAEVLLREVTREII